MPKHLENTLESLFRDNSLTSWTIHSNGKFTTVSMRFAMEDSTPAPTTNANTKFKRVSEAQRQKDINRAAKWNAKEYSDNSDLDIKTDSQDPETIIVKPKTTKQSKSVKQGNVDIATPQSGVTTRSKAKLNIDALPYTPSPVAQVDGQYDSNSTSVASAVNADMMKEILRRLDRMCEVDEDIKKQCERRLEDIKNWKE